MFNLEPSTFNVQLQTHGAAISAGTLNVEPGAWSVERYPQWELSGVFLAI